MSAASAEGSGPDGDNNKNAFYECNVCFDIATDPVLSLVITNNNSEKKISIWQMKKSEKKFQ